MKFEEIRPGSFIYRLNQALDKSICDDIVQRFELSTADQVPGRIGQSQKSVESIKKTTDIRVSGRSNWNDVDQCLYQSIANALSLVGGLHPFFVANKFKDSGYNLQRYEEGEYYHWHVDGGPGVFSQRQLVAIWYLNSVEGPGGETEFAHQQLEIKTGCRGLDFVSSHFGLTYTEAEPLARVKNILPQPGLTSLESSSGVF